MSEADDEEAGEFYTHAISGERKRRRGPRRRNPRGPYSLEEKNVIKAFDDWLSAERHMDGELAQATCKDMTVLLVLSRKACERYSYASCPDISGLDPHVIRDEVLGGAVVQEKEDVDVYEALRDKLT